MSQCFGKTAKRLEYWKGYCESQSGTTRFFKALMIWIFIILNININNLIYANHLSLLYYHFYHFLVIGGGGTFLLSIFLAPVGGANFFIVGGGGGLNVTYFYYMVVLFY